MPAIVIEASAPLIEAQAQFTRTFPYLGFSTQSDTALYGASHAIMLSPKMPVSEAEEVLSKAFGVPIQISRKTGSQWVPTAQTKNLTLGRQNALGKDLSVIHQHVAGFNMQ